MGTKLLDCTCLSNFPAPKLLRNPTLNCTRLYMAWGEQFARRKRKNLHVSIKGYLVPSSWGWSLYLLEDIGVFPHCPISPAVSLGVDPTLPPKWWEWMHFSHYLFYVQSPFITNVTSLIMFCCSYPKLVMMTYLCQIFIWRGFLLIVNVRVKNEDVKGCCHLTCREMRVSQRGQDPLLFRPQDSPIFQFWAI